MYSTPAARLHSDKKQARLFCARKKISAFKVGLRLTLYTALTTTEMRDMQ